MIVDKKRSLAQNILAKAHLATSLVNDSSINSEDIVYEIGPGTGIITKELAERAKKVVAIEKDSKLYIKLKKKFGGTGNITLFNADFLKFRISEAHYKIFANIPFNITSAVIRKAVYALNPPVEAYLIVQREAAEKFIGATKTTQFSVLVRPWFRLKIIRFFERTDFSPVPNVDVVMLYITKRTPYLIPKTEIAIYERFIKLGFGAWRKNLKLNYKGIFSYNQWKRLSRDLEFSVRVKPSELRFRQWLGLFEFFKRKLCKY